MAPLGNLQIIEAQYNIIEEQNRIIKAQAEALAQLGAVVMEEERAKAHADYLALLGSGEAPDEFAEEGGDSDA